jgi:hypothetical protein
MAKHNYQPTGGYVEQAKQNLISNSFASARAIREFLKEHPFSPYIIESNTGKKSDKSFRLDATIEPWGKVYAYVGKFGDMDNYIPFHDYSMGWGEIESRYGKILYQSDSRYVTQQGFMVVVDKMKNVTNSYVTSVFYASNSMPVGGIKNFIKTMDSRFRIVYEEKKKKKRAWYGRKITWKGVVSSVLSVGSVWALGAAGVALSKAVGIISTIGAIGGVIAGIGGLVVTFGMIGGSKTLAKIGSKISAIGALIGIGSSISNFLTSGASKAAASTLPNYNLANSQSLNQTASLYEGVSPASWANGSNLYQNTNSVMFSSEANSFKSALYGYNVGASAATSGISSANSSFLYLTKALKLAKLGFKSYEAINNLIGAFRTPNEFRDDDMVEPEDDDNKVSLSSSLDELEDAGVGVRRFYDRDVEYDLGLERGTLMSNDDSLL